MMPDTRLCLWSGPRNVSTAVMYAFARRADTTVVDEPLYAHYLRVTGAVHPGWRDVLANQENDGAIVVRDIFLGETTRPVLFLKSMAHHLVDLDLGFLSATTNVILTRDPLEMLPSLVNQIPDPGIEDTGLPQQVSLLERLDSVGRSPLVVDSMKLLKDPAGELARVCAFAGILFGREMLSWPKGPIPEDGVWAPHWYHNVHESTGFAPYRPKNEPFPDALRSLLAEASPYYDILRARA